MNYLQSMTNAADRAGVAESNFEKIDQLLTALLGGSGVGTNYRFKDGQFQFWDPAAYALDATKPWRALGVNNNQLGLSDPIDD